tara:strand:- start:667 stop:1182 length:516 start_codon:yes stop_codon:yes gene_type:complete
VRKLTIPRLKVISHRWVHDKKRIVKEGKPFLISVHLIKNNLYYKLHYESDGTRDCIRCDGNTDDTRYTYKTLYDEIYKNGWNEKYPATISIGPMGEVFYGNGNHRLNMVMNYMPHIKEIPVCINYANYSPYLTDITYRWHKYQDVTGAPGYSSMGYYKATAKFPNWRTHDN